MKPEDLQNIYQTPPEEFHNAVLSSLYRLDRKSPARYTKRRSVVRIAIVCAIVAALGTVSAVAASTKLFGLLSEPVGKYGLHVKVEEDTTQAVDPKVKYVKLKLGYMTDGFTEVPHTDGMKYHDGNDDGPGYTFIISRANDFDYTEEYIIDSEEMTANGHRLIITTRQMTEGGGLDYGATMYFEDWGYVVSCLAHHGAAKDELIKIMQNLDLEEDKDFVPESMPEDWELSELDEKRMNYGWEFAPHYKMYNVGDAFYWGEYADKNGTADDFTVKVTSVKEQTDTDGIPEENFGWITDYSLIYDEYFDENGNLITPYTRTDMTEGDGIHTQNKTWTTEDDRHFFVVTVEVTCNKSPETEIDGYTYHDHYFNVMGSMFPTVLLKDNQGNYSDNRQQDENGVWQDILHGNADIVCVTPGDDSNLARIEKGETRTFVYGIVVDDDVLDNTYITFFSRNEKVDDDAEKLIQNGYYSCIKFNK